MCRSPEAATSAGCPEEDAGEIGDVKNRTILFGPLGGLVQTTQCKHSMYTLATRVQRYTKKTHSEAETGRWDRGLFVQAGRPARVIIIGS